MENEHAQGSMLHIWTMVFGSIIFCLSVGLSWHFMEMRKLQVIAENEHEHMRANILVLSAYRDVLRDEGRVAADAYLHTIVMP